MTLSFFILTTCPRHCKWCSILKDSMTSLNINSSCTVVTGISVYAVESSGEIAWQFPCVVDKCYRSDMHATTETKQVFQALNFVSVEISCRDQSRLHSFPKTFLIFSIHIDISSSITFFRFNSLLVIEDASIRCCLSLWGEQQVLLMINLFFHHPILAVIWCFI